MGGMGGNMKAQIIQEIAEDVREDAKDVAHMVQNKRMQQRQNAFTEHMYRNRYQYAVEDLKKAGLNPMLAYMQSQPSPSGSGGGSSSAFGSRSRPVALQAKQMDLIEEEVKTQKSLQDTNSAVAAKNIAESGKLTSEKNVADALAKKIANEAIGIGYDNSAKSVRSDFWSGIRKWLKNPMKMKDFEEKLKIDMLEKFNKYPKRKLKLKQKKE